MARPRIHMGMTLIEVLIALFIFLVGIVGVLAAIPAGVNSGMSVIFQDAAIHLAHSKFAEFRADRVDPSLLDPTNAGNVLNTYGAVDAAATELGGGWRTFFSNAGETYENFDDIQRYRWKVVVTEVGRGANGVGPADPNAPKHPTPPGLTVAGAIPLLKRVTMFIHARGTAREFHFTQYMMPYDAP